MGLVEMSSFTATGPTKRRNIHGWPWSKRLRLSCSRTPAGMSTSKRRRRAFENYAADRGKASLIWNKTRTSLERVITSLGKLRLGVPRLRAILHMCRKVHHLHLLLHLLPSIRHHKLGGKQQPKVGRNKNMKALKRDKGKPTATQQLLAKRGHHNLPIPMHLSNAKALSLRTRNGDYYEVPDPKLKGTRAQERPDRSSRLQDSSEVIEYDLMNIADALISQIRQPPSIDGCQVCNPPLIKSS